ITLRRGWGFADRYERTVQEIRFTQQDIQAAKFRHDDLVKDKQRYEQLVQERTKQRDDLLSRITAAREQTAKSNAELKLLQDELFD
ncbi:hypothetical protein, partial [Klebsiella pneumoniae]|uniref:hypothetical protein n=1 Tax=Klebsiella pneumoniae TaxID=573 RepID=UPI001330F8A4